LVKRFFVGDQIGLPESDACFGQLSGIEFEVPANGPVGVIAQTLNIGDAHQEKIKSQRLTVATPDVVLTDQSMVNPTEAVGDLTESVRAEGMFFDHGLKSLSFVVDRGL
jgi:hypothetical protein